MEKKMETTKVYLGIILAYYIGRMEKTWKLQFRV